MQACDRSLQKTVAPLVCRGVVLLLVVGTAWGCGNDATLAPVEGVVRLDGQPLTTGTINFVPDEGRTASGKIASDGTFRLSTPGEGDGARIGNNGVSIIAYEGGSSSGPNFDMDRPQAKPLIPLRYASPQGSKLTFDVKAGVTNHAEFDLQSN